jgi:hypothetical protein
VARRRQARASTVRLARTEQQRRRNAQHVTQVSAARLMLRPWLAAICALDTECSEQLQPGVAHVTGHMPCALCGKTLNKVDTSHPADPKSSLVRCKQCVSAQARHLSCQHQAGYLLNVMGRLTTLEGNLAQRKTHGTWKAAQA